MGCASSRLPCEWHSLPDDIHLLVTDHLLLGWEEESTLSRKSVSKRVEDCLLLLYALGIPSWKRVEVGKRLHSAWNVWVPVTIGMESIGHGYGVLRSAFVTREWAILCSDVGHKLKVERGDTIRVGRDDRIQIVSGRGKVTRFLPSCHLRLRQGAFHLLEVDVTPGW
jgi:hypothetical protein